MGYKNKNDKKMHKKLGGARRESAKRQRELARERAIESTFIHTVSRNYQCIFSINLGSFQNSRHIFIL